MPTFRRDLPSSRAVRRTDLATSSESSSIRPSSLMRVAVASGKGGTGKTTVATSLAGELASRGEKVAYIDCDVEAPNGHIFMRPSITASMPVEVPVPLFDDAKCTGCGKCCEVCRFNALACLKDRVLAFHELCHGCGACSMVCPAGAVTETTRSIGLVESGTAGAVDFLGGKLSVGEPMATPVIRALLKRMPEDGVAVLDAPPGASCPVVETISSADLVLLVAEPTPFGLNDLAIAVETVRKLGVPAGVVVNRSGAGDGRLVEYCAREGLPVLAVIPDDRKIAEAYARGVMPAHVHDEFARIIGRLAGAVLSEGVGIGAA